MTKPSAALVCLLALTALAAAQAPAASHPIVLHAARMLDVKAGRIVSPAEILVEGDHIVEVGSTVKHPGGAEVIDLGDRTLLPGLIDAHIHLFLHPGAFSAHVPLGGETGHEVAARRQYRDERAL